MPPHPRWLQAHAPQFAPDTCVAACAAMLLRARGTNITERQLIQSWGPTHRGGYSLQQAASVLSGQHCFFNDPALHLPMIDAALLQGQGVFASVTGGPLTLCASQHTQPLYPAHGRPLVPGSGSGLLNVGLPHHAVLLIHLDLPDTYWIMDPWYTSSGQPYATNSDQLSNYLLNYYIL